MPPFVLARYGDARPPRPWDGGPPRLWLAGPTGGVAGHRSPDGTGIREDDWSLLDGAERARADALVRETDRAAYVAAHAVLRRLLGAYLRVAPAQVLCVREPCPCCGGDHGRPAIAGAPLHYSLSRSGGLVLAGFASVRIGVDIEEVPSPGTVDSVVHALHPDERDELLWQPDSERPGAFARCWTRKEAYLKGTGTGLAEDPSLTRVGAGREPAGVRGWSLADVPVPGPYRAACALRHTVTTGGGGR